MLDIPIVFLTAYADDKTLGRAKLAEPFGYIIKPVFEDADLRVTIEIALYKAKAEKERKELTLRLQKALDEIRTLSGLIPICASCKKVRDDTAYWQAVRQYIDQHPRAQSTSYQDSIALFAWEQYIEQQSGEQFTHGICPDCIKKLS
jgi:CheY-like chemotaxis protein